MHNSGARTLPKAGPRWFLELCFSCLLHRISSYPDEPSRDRAPPLNTGVQPAWAVMPLPVSVPAEDQHWLCLAFPGTREVFIELK